MTSVFAQPANANNVILKQFENIITVSSTVPANGDINPYGVAQVTNTIGKLNSGHILVSNFNNSQNLQGTGKTIVDVTSAGTLNLFAQIDADTLPNPGCPGGIFPPSWKYYLFFSKSASNKSHVLRDCPIIGLQIRAVFATAQKTHEGTKSTILIMGEHVVEWPLNSSGCRS